MLNYEYYGKENIFYMSLRHDFENVLQSKQRENLAKYKDFGKRITQTLVEISCAGTARLTYADSLFHISLITLREKKHGELVHTQILLSNPHHCGKRYSARIN